MTVVIEDQVKTITAELIEQMPGQVWGCVNLEDVVRAVIAMYDISDIGRMGPITVRLSGGEVGQTYELPELARPVDPVYLSAAIDGMVLAQAVVDHLKPVEDNL